MITPYVALEQRIAAWARSQDDVRAVVVIGSRARDDGTADAYSDLDLCLFTMAPDDYASSDAWLATFGTPWLTVLETTGHGDPEWLVIYESDLKADFALLPVDPHARSLTEQIRRAPHHNVFARGLRVLVDKYPQRERLELVIRHEPLPDGGRFDAQVRAFLLACVRVAKFVQRGDLWRAQALLSQAMRGQIMTMLTWHARSLRGDDYDTSYGGRDVEKWADQRAVAALPRLFPAYDRDAIRAALMAHLALMRWLAEETAARLSYAFPEATYTRTAAWIVKLNDGR
ncbi:MAG: aminoglycoside 6-adenylyltransferase [Anaerolineae bacterium]|nr:aminoglycoside 6-adenylyltransferase [Anaerolineae bacterium]